MKLQIRANVVTPGSYDTSNERILTGWKEEAEAQQLLSEYQKKVATGKLPEVQLLYVVSKPDENSDEIHISKERAIQILDPKHRESYKQSADGMKQVDEACRMGMVAIKRTIPIEPEFEGDGYAPEGGLVYDRAYCPECRHEFEFEVDDWGSAFCPDCGQALLWADN